MASNRYWYNNGKFETVISDPVLLSKLLLNSDQSIHFCWRTSGTRIPFYKEQFILIQKLIKKNHFSLESPLMPEFILENISSLLRRNRVFKGALIHIFILPLKRTDLDQLSGIYAFTEDFPDERFLMNQKGLQLGWIKKSYQAEEISLNALFYSRRIDTLWDKDLKKQKIDTAYLCNQNDKIVDCINSSLFIVKGDVLYTPSLSIGASPRAIRQVIIHHSASLGLKLIETDKLESIHLDAADEIFIANDLDGISWVVGHNNNRYFRKHSELLLNLINNDWEKGD